MTTTEVDYHLAAIARHLEALAEPTLAPRRMSLGEVLTGLRPSPTRRCLRRAHVGRS